MPTTPDAAESSTDQPDADPGSQGVGTQIGAAAPGDEPSTAPDTKEAEGGPGREVATADQTATDAGKCYGKSGRESFPPHGTLTLRALRWGGLIGTVAFGVTTLVPLRRLLDYGSPGPGVAIFTTGPILVGGALVWLFLKAMDKKRPVLVTTLTTIMAVIGTAASASVTLEWWNTYQTTGFSVLSFLTLAAANLAITLLLSISPLSHRLRTRTTATGIGDPNDPSR